MWLWKLLPEDWKFGVAIKKVSYTVGKLVVAGLMYGAIGKNVGSHLTPEQLAQVQVTMSAVAAATLEGVHDWAKLKWPDAAWL